MEKFDLISKMIDNWASSSLIIAGVVDFALRLVKSEKPLGVAYLIVDILGGLSKVFLKLAQFLDKVLPQRIK